MTKEEFLQKYGDVEVIFEHYYKYTFSFSATLPDGSKLSVDIGGVVSDIYKKDICANSPEKVSILDPCSGSVYDKTGKEVDSFYEYY